MAGWITSLAESFDPLDLRNISNGLNGLLGMKNLAGHQSSGNWQFKIEQVGSFVCGSVEEVGVCDTHIQPEMIEKSLVVFDGLEPGAVERQQLISSKIVK